MAVYTPPTETLPIFDNSVFPESITSALTPSTGKSYFLSYPVAQGIETIETLRTNFINTFGVLSNLVITSINNMTLNSGRAVSITSAQDMTLTSTAGNFTMNSDLSSLIFSAGTNSLRGNGNVTITSLAGNVSITGDSNASISGKTGTTTIGSASSSVNVPGGLTIGAGKDITLGDGSNVTLSSTLITPSTGQLGYLLSGVVVNQALSTTNNALITITNIPIGIYSFSFSTTVTNYTVGSSLAQFTISTVNIGTSAQAVNVGAAGTGANLQAVLLGFVKPTNAGNSIIINCIMSAGTATAVTPRYTLIRIA